MGDPINKYDPTGHFVITAAVIWTAIGIGAAIGIASGAIYGGVTAAANDQSVWAGIGIGALTGGLMGAGAALVIGTGIAFSSGAIGGAASDILTQLANTGKVSDWGSVGVSALQWGVINTAGAYLDSVGGPLSNLETALVTGVFNNVTSGIGLAVDVIRDRINKRKQMKTLLYMYNYGF